MSICGLSLHQGTTDSRKNLEQRFIFQIGTLNPHGVNEGSILLNINSQKFDNKEIGPLFLAPVLSSAFKIGMILAILAILNFLG